MAKQTPEAWFEDFKRRWAQTFIAENRWQKQVGLLLELIRKLVYGRFPDEAKKAGRIVLEEPA